MANSSSAAGGGVRSSPANRRISVIRPGSKRARNGRILIATIEVPVETLMAGPIGYRVQVVDYDSSTERFHGSHVLPAKLEDEAKSWREGRPSIVEGPIASMRRTCTRSL